VLSGIVRDRETGRPLPNVRITLQERPKSVTTRTDEDGRFRVTETSTFGYDLSLGRTGWDFSLRNNLFSAVMASAGDPFRILEVEMPAEAPFQVAWRRVPGSDAMGPYRIRVAANGTVTEREVEIFDPETSLLEIEAPDVPALTYGRYFR
jgi:hypothetical protein